MKLKSTDDVVKVLNGHIKTLPHKQCDSRKRNKFVAFIFSNQTIGMVPNKCQAHQAAATHPKCCYDRPDQHHENGPDQTGLEPLHWFTRDRMDSCLNTSQSCLLVLRPPDPSGHQGQGCCVFPGSEPTLTLTVCTPEECRHSRLIYIRAENVVYCKLQAYFNLSNLWCICLISCF